MPTISDRVDLLESQVESVEQEIRDIKQSLIEFDEFVGAALGQVLEVLGEEGVLGRQINAIAQSTSEVNSTLQESLANVGDSRTLESIKVSTQEIKRAVGVS